MSAAKARSNLVEAVERLRAICLNVHVGELLGSEDALVRQLGVSRPTVRQAARLVEREGLLQVKRGKNGGYFALRPDPDFIEATVATYLDVVRASPSEMVRVGTALWIETVRHLVAVQPQEMPNLVTRYRKALVRLPDQAGLAEVQVLDQKIRSEIFKLVDSPYVELIFNTNATFVRRHADELSATPDDTESHLRFVRAWRRAVMMTLEAIEAGDAEIAVIVAARSRTMLYERIWPEIAPAAAPS